ncbi:MAG: DUF1836 domain-containing protein [Clostridia bacterium]|nr:DUF1836 domain-containing protein [Clostridia bacterium]
MKLTKLPGTNVPMEEQADGKQILDGLFAAGGIVLSQITALVDIEGYTVQNWIKRRFVSSPAAKKYSKNQFCRLVIINLLKDSLSIPEITGLLEYINGRLDDESDDIIDDALLYEYFVRTLRLSPRRTAESFEEAARAAVKEHPFKEGEDAERVVAVLVIMCIAFSSSELQKTAKKRIASLV